MSRRATPYLRILTPFVTGLSLGGLHGQAIPGLPAAVVTAGVLVLLAAAWQIRFRYRWVFGVLLYLFSMGAGYWYAVRHDERNLPGHFEKEVSSLRVWVGEVTDAPAKGNKWKIPLQVLAAGATTSDLRPCTGNLLLFADSMGAVRYGDRVLVRGRIQSCQAPANPHSFDYRRYLHFQNIHYQAFIRSDSLTVLSSGHGSLLWRAACSCRAALLGVLEKHFPGTDEYAVAAALLVGFKDDLSDEIRTAYAETGSMHALAVSGTHVGILYAGLMFMLQRLRLRKRWVETLLILLVIWGFTLITGATASVLRASVMFSTYLLGRLMYRESANWNTLASSAMLLLWYNPYFLFDAGFQLSYAAVAGMMFFYPRLKQLTPLFLPRWLEEGWKILLVGVAAQIGTLPLSLYYFHQFPVYFWLAGWVVVLGGAVFLWGGAMLLLLDATAPVLAAWLGWLLNGMVWGMNQIIFGIQQLPLAVLEGIWLPVWAAAALYAALGCIAAAVSVKSPRWLLAACALIAVLSVGHGWREWSRMQQVHLSVYHVKGATMVDFFAGDRVYCLRDTLNKRQIDMAALGHRCWAGVRQEIVIFTASDSVIQEPGFSWKKPLACLAGQRMILLDPASWRQWKDRAAVAAQTDWLLLSHSPDLSIADCQGSFSFQKVVFDASNKWRALDQWEKACLAAGIPYERR